MPVWKRVDDGLLQDRIRIHFCHGFYLIVVAQIQSSIQKKITIRLSSKKNHHWTVRSDRAVVRAGQAHHVAAVPSVRGCRPSLKQRIHAAAAVTGPDGERGRNGTARTAR